MTTCYEGVEINIPVGIILSARKGEFCFRNDITGTLSTCNKIEYRGNGRWLFLAEKHDVEEEKIND